MCACDAACILEKIDPEENTTRLPPVKPKAGEVYLYLNDCGLFAVAFATALAFGYNSGQYFFDQPYYEKASLELFTEPKYVNVSCY